MSESAVALRLERLERQNRRLRHALLAMGLVVAALVSMAQVNPFPPEIRAQRLVLVDQNGQPRIDLRADGVAPSVTLRDEDGVLVELTAEGDRGIVRYVDELGLVRELTAPPGPRPLTRGPR